jgi:hypothetical protein
MKRTILIVALALVALALAGCAPGPNSLGNTPDSKGAVHGFWRGLWNGATVVITFIVSLFNKNVTVYEVHNNGTMYNLGFLLGAMMALGGGAGGAAARRRRRD